MKRNSLLLFLTCLFVIHNSMDLTAQNYSLAFDGTDDYVQIPPCEALTSDEFTIEAWFKAPQTGVQQTILLAYKDIPAKNGQVQCEVNRTGVFRFNYRPFVAALGGTNLYSTSIVSDNAWHHFAVVKQGQILALYIDGTLEKYEFGTFDNIIDAPKIELGWNKYDNTENFRKYSGQLDDLKIWTKAKSNQEVLDTYQSESAGNASDLFANYQMDETLDIVFDCSANQGHGERLGTAGNNDRPQYSTDVAPITNVDCAFDIPNTSTCTNNLLQNSDFSQNLIHWNGSGGTIQNGALQLCNQGEIRRQTIAAEAGKNYQLHYIAKTMGAGQNVLFGIKFLDAAWIPLDAEWSNFDSPGTFSSNFIEKTAPSATTYVEVNIIKENNGCVEVEEVCLTTGGGTDPCDNDTEAPTISGCPTDISQTTTTQTANVNWTVPTSTDNCETSSLSANYTSGNAFPIGTTQVLYTAIDAANNTATCAFSVNISEQNTGGGCTNSLLENGEFNNGIQGWQVSGATVQNGRLRLCTIGDFARQTKAASSGENYRFIYTAKTVGNNQNILFGIKFLDANWSPIGSEWSSFDSPAGFESDFIEAVAPAGTAWIEVNILKQNTGCVEVDDLCLTSDFNPDPCFMDEEPPMFTFCPNDTTVYTTEPRARVEWEQPLANDDCSVVTISGSVNSGTFFYKYPSTVVFTAMDESGNSATCNFVVTVRDPNNVDICPNNLLMNSDFQNGLSDWQNNGAVVESGFLKLCSTNAKVSQLVPAMDTSSYVLVYSLSTPSEQDSLQTTIRFYASDSQTELGVFQKNISTNGYLADKFLGLIPPVGTAFIRLEIQSTVNTCIEIASICLLPETLGDCTYDYIPPTINGCPSDTTIYTSSLPAVYRYSDNTQAIDNCSIKSFSRGFNEVLYQVGVNEILLSAYDQVDNRTDCEFTINVLLENIPINCSNSLLTNSEFTASNGWSTIGGNIQNGKLQLCNKDDIAQQTVVGEAGAIYKLQYNAKTLAIGQNVLFGIKFLDANYLPIGDMYSSFDSPGAFSSNFIQAEAPSGTVWVEAAIIKENDGCIEVNEVCLSKRQEVFTPTQPCSAFEMDGYGVFAGFTQSGDIKIYRNFLGIKKMIYISPEGGFLFSEALKNHSYVQTPWSINGTTIKHRITNETHVLPQALADRFSARADVYKSGSKYLFSYFSADSKAVLLQTDFSFNIQKTDTIQNSGLGIPQAMWVNEDGQIIIRFFAQTHNFYGATRGGANFAFLDAHFNIISGITKTNPTETWLSEQVFQIESTDGGSFYGHGIQGIYNSSSTALLGPTFAYDRVYNSSYSTTSNGRGASSTSSGSSTSVHTKSFPTNEDIMARWGGGTTAYYRPSNGFYGPNGGTTYSSNTVPATVKFTNNKTINIGSTGGFHAPISTNGYEYLILHIGGRTIFQKVDCDPSANEHDIKIELSASQTNPGQWKDISFELKIINEGTQSAQNIQVQLPPQSDVNFRDQLAYVSHTAEAGTFNSWTGIWEIPELAAWQSIILTYEGFTKIAGQIPIFSQIIAQSPTDADSSPNNNTTGIPVEDDEALLVLNDVMPLQQGTLEIIEHGDALIYPNPVSRVLNIDLGDFEGEDVTVTMVDALGRVAQSKQSTSSSLLNWDVQSLENGLYFLKIQTEDRRPIVRRVVVEHGF